MRSVVKIMAEIIRAHLRRRMTAALTRMQAPRKRAPLAAPGDDGGQYGEGNGQSRGGEGQRREITQPGLQKQPAGAPK
jgi:hypothetical protein